MKNAFFVVALAVLIAQAVSQDMSTGSTSTPTPTPTSSASGVPTSTPTVTSTATPAVTNTSTPTPTPTKNSTVTPTPGPTRPAPAPTSKPPVRGPTPSPTVRPPMAGPTGSPTVRPTPSGGGGGTTPGGGGSSSGGSTSGGSSSGGSSVPNAAGLSPGSGSTPTDADILYFAYNLEVFEADFYSCATTGQPISSQYTGNGPAPTGCQQANLSSAVGTFIAELAREETAHVALLYKALQSAGVTPNAPAIDISVATWGKLAQAVPGGVANYSPYTGDLPFLTAAFDFEDLGASAYIGAANSISNSNTRLTAIQIGGAEAYHASLVRTLLYQNLMSATGYGPTVQSITNGVVSYENQVAQAPQIKYQLTNNQGSSVSNVDSNGLVPGASSQQVLRVVTFGAPAGSGGGFFPNNFQGNVKN